MEDLSHYRKSYERGQLLENALPETPMPLFHEWFLQADAAKKGEANAMTVATLGEDGFPLSRIVLLKGYDDQGFVFYTNYDSQKGKAIQKHPQVCLSFFWEALERQVIVRGIAEKVAPAQSEAYFHSRPRGSQLGANASPQSQVIASREWLDEKIAALDSAFEGKEIPKPGHWGGYLVRPVSVEFWQGRANRLHDRIRYALSGRSWTRERLAP
jgi:pyridoxamine 5'-phosphate oxidase